MNNQTQQELLNKTSSFLSQASHLLGQTASTVYEIMVRQQYIIGVSELSQWVFIIIIGMILSIPFFKQAQKEAKKSTDDDTSSIYGFAFFIWLVSLFFLWIVSNIIIDGIQHIINPQYFAIQNILQSITGNSN